MNEALHDGSGQWETSSFEAEEVWTESGESDVGASSSAGGMAAQAVGVLALWLKARLPNSVGGGIWNA